MLKNVRNKGEGAGHEHDNVDAETIRRHMAQHDKEQIEQEILRKTNQVDDDSKDNNKKDSTIKNKLVLKTCLSR